MIFGQRDLSAADIAHRFATARNVTLKQLRGPIRTRPIVHYRQECMAMLRDKTDMSLPDIGRFFNRDHTTVLHALSAVERRAAEEEGAI